MAVVRKWCLARKSFELVNKVGLIVVPLSVCDLSPVAEAGFLDCRLDKIIAYNPRVKFWRHSEVIGECALQALARCVRLILQLPDVDITLMGTEKSQRRVNATV